MTGQRLQRRLAAILVADMVGYSRLMEQDEAGTLAQLRALRRDVVDPDLAAHGGRLVKDMGDGVLAEFGSAVDAVACAISIQERLRAAGGPIVLRIGINLGDVVVEGDDLFGDGVNLAARIEAAAEPGGVWLSRAVAEQVRDKVAAPIESCGPHTLKNIARPVELFRVAGPTAAGPATRAAPSSPPQARPAIAVLAFQNLSGDPEQAYFSDGISEDIITDLARLPALHVIARNSSFAYKGRQADVRAIGRELGVGYLLEGSVRRAGERIRVTCQLVETAGGGQLWAERFDRSLTDVFALQDELTREIVAALKLRLTPEQQSRLGRRGTADVEAYTMFLRGREQALLMSRGGNAEARRLLGRAIDIDPGFASAHAYYAFTHMNDYISAWAEQPERSLADGLALARRAIAMDPEDPYARFVHADGLLWHREHDAAMAEVRRCLDLAPSSAEGHIECANIQYYAADPAGALATLDAYMRLDPLYPEITLYFLAQAQFALGAMAEAGATLRHRLERNPGSPTSLALLAACYGHLGQLDEARAAWAELMRLSPDFSMERRRRVLPFRDPAMLEQRLEGLRRAGLPA
ncbi:MAG: adenylate/guanylate cyclase domain-containing protein [Dongiaceae bacterium]